MDKIQPESKCALCWKSAKDIVKSGCGAQHNGQAVCHALYKSDIKTPPGAQRRKAEEK